MVPSSSWFVSFVILALASWLPGTADASGSCGINYRYSCTPIDFSATYNLFFIVHQLDDAETYDATVIFHWGVEDVTVDLQSYQVGEEIALSRTFEYDSEGTYDVGHTLIFSDNAGPACSGKTFHKMVAELKMESNSCNWNEKEGDATPVEPPPVPQDVPAPAPNTNEQEVIATTPAPTARPTVADLPLVTLSSCSVSSQFSCDPSNLGATSNVNFIANPTVVNGDLGTYAASVVFHWGDEEISTGFQTYQLGDPMSLSNAFEFDEVGQYEVGYSLIFEGDTVANCADQTFSGTFVLTMNTNDCELVEGLLATEDTPAPSAPKVSSSSPTASPTASPETDSPVANETPAPSTSPTNAPTSPPIDATSNDIDEVEDIGPSPTASCYVDFQYYCNPLNTSVTSNLFFTADSISNGDIDTYDANVIFHQGSENITLGSQPYQIGKTIALSNSYVFKTKGSYNVGYTLSFGYESTIACKGKVFSKYALLRMTPKERCDWAADTSATPFQVVVPVVSDEEAPSESTDQSSVYFACRICRPNQVGINNPINFNGAQTDCQEAYDYMLTNFMEGSDSCTDAQESISDACCQDLEAAEDIPTFTVDRSQPSGSPVISPVGTTGTSNTPVNRIPTAGPTETWWVDSVKSGANSMGYTWGHILLVCIVYSGWNRITG